MNYFYNIYGSFINKEEPLLNTPTPFKCTQPSLIYSAPPINKSSKKDDCLVLPIKIDDCKNVNTHTITNSDHGYEIYLYNYPQKKPTTTRVNTPPSIKISKVYDISKNMYLDSVEKLSPSSTTLLYVDNLVANFFTIINTSNINQKIGGIIQLLPTTIKQELVIINNNNIITTGVCSNSGKFSYSMTSQPKPTRITAIKYSGNPRIYIYSDIKACKATQEKPYIYVYFEYNTIPDSSTCVNNLIFTQLDSSISKLMPNMHGFEYNIYNTRNFSINFNPIDNLYGTPYGYVVIINTGKNTSSNMTTTGSIIIDNLIISNNLKKKNCILYNFYITDIQLSSFLPWINDIVKINNTAPPINSLDPSKISGPYSSIKYYGTPKIVIYIPPFILNNNQYSSNPIYYRNFQNNPNVCNIFVNLIY